MPSKRVLKSWRAVAYCALPGRISEPCKLLASDSQSAPVGDGCVVGVGVPPGDDPFWQAASRPVNPPRTLSLRKSRRFVPPGSIASCVVIVRWRCEAIAQFLQLLLLNSRPLQAAEYR